MMTALRNSKPLSMWLGTWSTGMSCSRVFNATFGRNAILFAMDRSWSWSIARPASLRRDDIMLRSLTGRPSA